MTETSWMLAPEKASGVDKDKPLPTSLLALADAPVTRTGGDALQLPGTPGTEAKPVIDVNQLREAIAIEKANLARLFDEKGDLKPGTITENGQKLTTEQYRDMILSRISLMYETGIDNARANQYPGNDARIANGFRNADVIQKELKEKYGIELQTGFGGKLTSYTVEQQINVTTNAEARKLLGELQSSIRGINQAAINQNAPDRLTMEYADFLRNIGLTKQAETLLSDVGRNSATRYSKRFEELNEKILKDFATARSKVVPRDQDPFDSLGQARAAIARGDTKSAEAAYAQAYDRIAKLPKDKIEAEAKRLIEAQDSVDKQMAEMKEQGLLTPAKQAQLQFQKQNLLMLQSVWEEFLLAKQFVEIEHAHYLLNNSPNKDKTETKRGALDMLDDVRYSDKGKIALLRHMQLRGEGDFSRDIVLASQGKPDQMTAFTQYNDSMAKSAKLMAEAHAIMEKNEEEASKKLQQARMNAENAESFASHIDVNEARQMGEQTRKNIRRLIDEEKAKPDASRNQSKVALLEHLLKPMKDRDPATMALLDNALLGEKGDKAKAKQLRDMLKDDLSMMDVLQLHAALVDAHGMEHAANSARFAMLQVDAETGKGEDNPLVKTIEDNDPNGAFRDMLNWADVKEKTRHIEWYERLWRGTKDIFIGLASSLVAAGTFVVLTGSTLGFGAPVGVAGGIATGTATYCGLKKLCGDDLTLGDVGMGVVNSIPGVAFVGAGRALQGASIMLKIPGFARPAATLFLQGMAANASYHTSYAGLQYAEGIHPDMLTALKSAGSRTLKDVPQVALFSVIGGFGGGQASNAASRELGVNISRSVAKDVFSQWGRMGLASEPALAIQRAKDANEINRYTRMMLEQQRRLDELSGHR